MIKTETNLSSLTCGSDWDCLVDLASEAESARGDLDDNPILEAALNHHILLCSDDGAIELQCHKCPVTCTAKEVGGSGILLVHNRVDCAKTE